MSRVAEGGKNGQTASMTPPLNARARIGTRLLPVLGFAAPWRGTMALAGRAVHISAFDLLLPFAVVWDLLFVKRTRGRHSWLALLWVLTFMEVVQLGATPLGPAALATIFALAAGWWMAVVMSAKGEITAGETPIHLDPDAFWTGLERGMLVSTFLGGAMLFVGPDLVREGPDFCGFHGTKNGFAFLAGLLAIRAMSSGRSAASAAWFALTILTHARTASAAAAIAALLAIPRASGSPRVKIAAGCAMTLGAAWMLVESDFNGDRLWFARAIILHAREIPLLGIGAGSGFGLDLYFKSWLEFGWIGGGLLLAMIALAMRRAASPELAFVLIFGLAHDPTRWPIFWMLLLRDARPAAVATPS
jgi:hypothetical protein